MRQMKFRKFCLVGTLALLMLGASGALLALTIDRQFDGQWYESDLNARRGWNLQYIETGPEQGLLFVVGFIYDDGGNPYWVNGASEVIPGQFEVSIPLELVEGGIIGPGEGNPATTDANWGTLDITFQDCNNAEISFDTPLGDGSNEFKPILNLVKGSTNDRCVYQQPFTSCPAFSAAAACTVSTGLPRKVSVPT
jgi:hypothetical protein